MGGAHRPVGGVESMTVKMDDEDTPIDGGEPIMVRAARRVRDILKCVADGGKVQPTFRFFM
jgi:hypothetical protein